MRFGLLAFLVLTTPLGLRAEEVDYEKLFAYVQRTSTLAQIEAQESVGDIVKPNLLPFRVRSHDMPFFLRFGQAIAEAETPESRFRQLALEARVLLSQASGASDSIFAAARAAFLEALDFATQAGLSDRQIASLLLDLAQVEFLDGDPDAAQGYFDRAIPCRANACPEELTDRSDLPESSRFLSLTRAEEDDLVAAFFAAHLPGNTSAPARFLAVRAYRLNHQYPMEAASYMDRAWLTGRQAQHGLEAMGFALRANRFARLRQIAAEMADRGLVETLPPREALEYRRLDLRAAFRMGDPAAPGAHDALVDQAIADFLDPDRFPDAYNLPTELDHLLRNLMDTDNLAAAFRLSWAMVERESETHKWESLWTRRARLFHRDGRSIEAADILSQLREIRARGVGADPMLEVQEAAYARAGGDLARAEALMGLHPPRSFTVPATGEPLPPRDFMAPRVFDTALTIRNDGNHEAAAWWLADELRYVPTVAAEGDYPSAQRLWQVAYTLAIGGEPRAAFSVMSRAAAIAARLSFADPTGEAGGSLQLLQRDNWRYLLFVDIAWAAAKGRPTESLLVVSDY